MKVSASIELLWNMAAQEAIAAEFEEIQPEHFLEALLKFSELPLDQMAAREGGAEVARQLRGEVGAVREALAGRAIDGRALRRQLRSRLGRGNHPYEGGVLHRSGEAKQVFAEAARFADQSESGVFMAIHLLEAVLAAATPAIRDVFGAAAGPRAPEPTDTPLLNEYGRDLVQLAAEGAIQPQPGRTAQRSALIQALTQKDRKSVLLICERDADARAVAEAAAHAMAAGEAGPGTRGKRFIDVTATGGAKTARAGVPDRMVDFLSEAAKAAEVILFLPAIAPAGPSEGAGKWAGLLKSVLAKDQLQCVCRASPEVYRTEIGKDPAWKRHARFIFIHDAAPSEIPEEI